MMATLSRSRPVEVNAPRFENAGMPDTTESLSGRRYCQIGAAAAGQQAPLFVEDLGFRNRELLAEMHDLAANRQHAGHRGAVVVDTQIRGRNPAPGLGDHGPIRREVDERSQDTAMGITAI